MDHNVTNDWGSGFVADVTIKNEGGPINGWTLTWSFPDGQRVTNLWNGNHTRSDGKVTVTPVDWNASIGTGGTATPPSWNADLAPGQSTTIGYQADGPAAAPSGVTLNGVACS